MRNSRDHILTSHVGSLPRPDNLIAANRARDEGTADEAGFQALLKSAVADVVALQKKSGVDVPNDGEFGKSMGHAVNYRSWWSYAFNRLTGLDLSKHSANYPTMGSSKSGDIIVSDIGKRRDRAHFAAAYADPEAGIYVKDRETFVRPVCVGPVAYKGHDAIKTDVANLKAALAANGISEGFMTSVAPGSLSRLGNTYYKTHEEFLFACADAMREEYKAIVDAGLILQIDDPAIAENWDAITPEPSLEAYKKFTMGLVEAINHAIRGLPPDRIRFHLCWGSWHGPHMTDIPMRDIVDVMLADQRTGLFVRGRQRASRTRMSPCGRT